MKVIGFLVNPVAGIGGKVGLKGSDGAETLAKALSLGAVPEAGKKAGVAIAALKDADCRVITYPREMGEDICKAAGIPCEVVGEIESGHTTPEDTLRAVRHLRSLEPDLLLFAGGDGTARNVLDAFGDDVATDHQVPALGIPAGCKIHSGVYALNPRSAGELLAKFCRGQVPETRLGEVMDIDEDLFREGRVQARLYGYLRVPKERKLVQNLKSGRGASEQEAVSQIAVYFEQLMEPDTLYIMGTGGTTASLMKHLELPNTLLGVDLVYNGKVIASDCTEKDILEKLPLYPKRKIVVTVIGGQGYIFGRGNQQLSANVIREVGRENIMVVATKDKLFNLPNFKLYVDTGDEDVNAMLRGHFRVLVGYEEHIVLPVTD